MQALRARPVLLFVLALIPLSALCLAGYLHAGWGLPFVCLIASAVAGFFGRFSSDIQPSFRQRSAKTKWMALWATVASQVLPILWISARAWKSDETEALAALFSLALEGATPLWILLGLFLGYLVSWIICDIGVWIGTWFASVKLP